MKTKEIEKRPARSETAVQTAAAPLEVTEVKPGLHEKAEGIINRPVYRLCWPRPPRRSLGPLRLPGAGTCSGMFIKLSPERICLADEATRRYQVVSADPLVEETAVFLRTQFGSARLELILASRTDSQWSALYHWSDTWRGLGISRMDIVH